MQQRNFMATVPEPAKGGTPSLLVEGNIATITLNRPDVANRLIPEDLDELRAHIDSVNQSEVLVLRIRGNGKYFCSGFDIGQIDPSRKGGSGFEETVDALEDCRPVTIAAINGGVYGGATDLALACDFRVGIHGAEMFMPAARLGLHFYRRGLERFHSRLGLDMAKRLFLTAQTLGAEEMLRCGFLTDLSSPEDFEALVQKLSSTVASMAPLAVTGMKRHLNRMSRGALVADELQADIVKAALSSDLKEGGLAWKEKRKPVFTGR
jgi:enoyl-CoA hydratase